MLARSVSILSGVALAIFLVACVWLGRLERGGPAHSDVVLEGAIPATLYLPRPADERAAFLDPPRRGERPPALVLMHGFASDRMGVSSPARRLAGAGYAVLTLDVRGHGQNRNPYLPSFGRADFFYPDLSVAVDFLRASPLVDGSRIALMGHSMGAAAALDYGTRDSGIDGVVLISGGWTLQGPYRPPNALFVYASRDPKRIKQRARELAARLAGVAAIEPGRVYGDTSKGTGVLAVEVPGVDHATILWSGLALGRVVDWLDAIFGMARAAPKTPADPRLPAALVLSVALLFALPGLGLLVGRLAPAAQPLPARGRASGLLALLAALLLTMPLLAVGTPGAILSVEVGDVVVTHLALAGIALLAGLALMRGEFALLTRGAAQTLAAAALGLVGVYCLIYPLGVIVHRVALTPERALVLLAAAVALLPFSLAFQLLLRRGPPATATLFAVAGRLLVLLSLVAGIHFGILSDVVLLMLPALALVFALFELLAASIYSASRNLATIALIEAGWLAFSVASSMPVRL